MTPFQKAEGLLGKVTRTEEHPDCFFFFNDEKKQDGVIVIMKNGKILSMADYIMRR